jgi:hypothetical protein
MSADDFRIVVEKLSRTLAVFENGRLMRSYPVTLGRNPAADKTV